MPSFGDSADGTQERLKLFVAVRTSRSRRVDSAEGTQERLKLVLRVTGLPGVESLVRAEGTQERLKPADLSRPPPIPQLVRPKVLKRLKLLQTTSGIRGQ